MAIDITTEVGQVRYNIGDIIEPYLLEDDVIQFLLDKNPDDPSEIRVWKATIAALRVLKGRFSLEGERRREREGGVEVEVSSSNIFSNLCDLLHWFELNPPGGVKKHYDLHIFGGVSKREMERVRCNPDSPKPNAYLGMTYERERGINICDIWRGWLFDENRYS